MTGMNHPYGGYYTYEYNDEGLLTKKTGEGMTTEFIYDGTRLISVKQTWYTIIYLYDDGMTPIGMLYRSSTGTEWVTYWFERNLQGDIVAVYSANGTKLLSYTYDAFGNKATKYLATDTGHGASMNYIGYRGYYYDFDLGLYFTQTRLYDPTTGRFISADAYISTGQGFIGNNMYAYCLNNPVNMVDYSGEFGLLLFLKVCAIIAAVIVATVAISAAVNHIVNEANHNEIKQEIDEKYGETISDEVAQTAVNDYLGKYNTEKEKLELIYDENSFQIKNSYLVSSRYDRQYVCEILARTNKTNREYDHMSAEWFGHNFVYFFTGSDATANVDLDYTEDPRAWVVGITKAVEITGWD